MKKFSLLLLLIPCLLLSQENNEYTVIENAMISVNPEKIMAFEKGIAAHNKKFHAEGAFGARVYWISNGKNVGKYIWVMGPLPWAAFDNRPAQEGHEADWNTNVVPYIMAEGDQTYWRFHSDKSHFPANFELKNLWVRTFDVKRFKQDDAMDLIAKIQKAMVDKMPEETFGVYTNEFPSMSDQKDLAFVNFFGNSAWIGEDGKFSEHYEATHGAGSFEQLMTDWGEVTHGTYSSELWLFRPDLSGLSGNIDAAQRQ